MFSAFKVSSSSCSIISCSARRVYHSTSKSLKASIEGPSQSTTKSTIDVTVGSVPKSSAADAATTTTSASAVSPVKGGGFWTWIKENPFVFQLGVATAKTSGADIVAQVVAERKSWDEIDWKRNGIFVVFGFAYLGGFQYYLMVNKYRQWFPTMDRFAKLSFAEKLKDTAGILDAAKMVLFDVCIHLPMLYFPTYYTVKELIGGNSWNPSDWVKDGVTKYAGNAKEDLTAMIKLWGPSDCIQFVLPVHIRLPFRHVVSFFWTAYVSFTRGALDDAEDVVVVKMDGAEK